MDRYLRMSENQTQRKIGKIRHVDETYVKVKGRWCYLYRAMDQYGNLVDSRLNKKRDMAAAKAFFAQTQEVAEDTPDEVVTDGHTSYPRAIAEVRGPEATHHQVGCVANAIEQDHRAIKQRYYPTLGFNHFDAAQRFCRMVDEVRNFFRPRQRMGQFVSLAQRRTHFLRRVDELYSLFAPA